MLRAPHSGKTLSLIVALLFVPHISRAQVDTAVVAKILGGEELSRPHEMDDATSNKLLDVMSNSATKLLGQDNKDWNASSPRWKTVYDRVHSDLESEMPSILADIKSNGPKMQQAYEADIAAHISQSDVDAILAYYDAPEGQRYQEFLRAVDRIIGSANFVFTDDERQAATKLPPEQKEQDVRMLMLSRLFQPVVAMSQARHDPSGGGGIGFLMTPAIIKRQKELEALDKEYDGDLVSFETFTKTDAAQHLFVAMGEAMQHRTQFDSIADSFKAAEQKHESEWKALYLAQSNP
jgi:hypothetical protein